ncbi:MAG: GIY-YIG nuclease family protein [Candidatus Gracilibacteria bacterium]|nr:GIY-YIG nuclease family protein [Candidatus Gracilibacteria bacterium]
MDTPAQREDGRGMGVYILRCADETLYTGATKDVERRIMEHNSDTIGAKYTKIRRPVSLVYFETCESWSGACKREFAIKQLSREKKLELVREYTLDKTKDRVAL